MKSYKYDGIRQFNIRTFDCADKGDLKERSEAIREFTENLEKINEYQQKLFAEKKEGIIFIFQAMDAAGKDGAVRAVLSCLSPQGVSEHSFKVPSAEENSHDYLWRFWSALPEKGAISIFNRSYYEDVLVQKVHKYYEKNRYADRIDLDTMIEKRYEQIRNFEKYLWENSIRVVKIFLNVSKDEQASRFLSRIDTPKKNWKFSSSDIDERAYWDEYMDAYETCINRTARKNTPWYVVPADHKWYARLVISRIVLNELMNMNPQWPVLDEEQKARLETYRQTLLKEFVPAEQEDDKEEEPVMKLKPSATAVGIALKNDRKALSEKKFRKALKKSVFENFCARFGVSEGTQDRLGSIYLSYEEQEVAAETDDLRQLKDRFDENRKELARQLKGFGKEARKLLERFEKVSKKQIKTFSDEINLAYGSYEEQMRQYMTDYELDVSAADTTPEAALAMYASAVRDAFAAHRAFIAEKRNEAEQVLDEIMTQYSEKGKDFCPAADDEELDSETPNAEEAAADEGLNPEEGGDISPEEQVQAQEEAAPAEESAPAELS